MRKSLYLSERLDKDIIQELDLENIEEGNFSLEVKNLMRDGIKWRALGDTEPKSKLKAVPNPVEPTTEEITFDDIKLQKKELSDSDLDSKLNSL